MKENDKIQKLLEEILKWQKLQGLIALKKLVPEIINTKEKELVYELTDGKHTIREINKKTGIGIGTISTWWQEWYECGILIKVNNKYKKIFSLKILKPFLKVDKNETKR